MGRQFETCAAASINIALDVNQHPDFSYLPRNAIRRCMSNTHIGTLGTRADYRPIDILSVLKKVNYQPSPLGPPKTKYAGIDTMRWANHYGIRRSPNKGTDPHFSGKIAPKGRCSRGSESRHKCLVSSRSRARRTNAW